MTQPDALEIMKSGANVFLTGAPGSGKTYLLNEFIKWAKTNGRLVAITASTGIAASHIGGTTIHSWSGLGIAEDLSPEDLRRFQNKGRLIKRYKKTDVLVIDEVSMLHGHRLDMVNVLARALRNKRQAFGGMQVILVGDLFQLPPVSHDNSLPDFIHLSDSWGQLDLRICYLTEQHRQESDDTLLKILECMRQNSVTGIQLVTLKQRINVKASDGITKLYSHNVDVDYVNKQHLDALPGKTKTYSMSFDGRDQYKIDALKRNILAPEKLVLKVGAEVMFVANNFQDGFVNGSRGRVIKFSKSGEPIVRLHNGRNVKVEYHTWKTEEDGHTVAEVSQLPLRLAWAITIHKSQGMSLDAAEIDLSAAFTPGMGYVALSRIRSLKGLYLNGINDMALTMHPDIFELDLKLREASK